MKSIPSILAGAVLALASTAASAGTYIEEVHTMAAQGQSQAVTIKTWVEAENIRTDDPRTGTVMLINTRKGSIMGVDKAKKEWWRIKEADMAMFGQSMLMAYGIKPGPDGKLQVPAKIFERTGQKKKVEGWDAYEVKINVDTASMPGFKSVMWFAVVPGYDPVIQRNRMKMFLGNGPESDAFLAQWDTLEGVPVITELTIPAGPNMVMQMNQEVKKVASQKLTPDAMAVPKGFKQGKDPITQMKEEMKKRGQGMPGGMGGGPPAAPAGQAPPPMN